MPRFRLAVLALALALPAAALPPAPRPGQTDLELGSRAGFTAGGSVAAVRENDVPGSRVRFADLGLSAAHAESLSLTRWLGARDGLSLGARWLFLRGRADVGGPFDFNGATIAGGQSVSASADAWTLSARWTRRLAPEGLGDWDLRARAGLDYAHLDLRIDDGHARVTPASRGTETKEDFYAQELPVPVLGLEALRRVGPRLVADLSAEGSWISRWDSLRREGGDVRLSQSSFELRARLLWDDPRLRGWRPALGGFFAHFAQEETSGEDGNFVRYESYGPELSLAYSF